MLLVVIAPLAGLATRVSGSAPTFWLLAAREPTRAYIELMELFDLSLFAVQRLADGTWLVRTQMGDPILPAVDVVVVVGAQTDIRRDPESAAAQAASAQVISSMRDSAQVTSFGAINSMIATMSTRPNRQNRSTSSRISVPIALTLPPPCELVHMRCAPMRRTRAHCAANPISPGQAGGQAGG